LRLHERDSDAIERLARDPAFGGARGEPLYADLPYRVCDVIWATRCELARTVEDVLARRTRFLFLNAKAAIEIAPRVASLMAAELRRDAAWEREQTQRFCETARGYLA